MGKYFSSILIIIVIGYLLSVYHDEYTNSSNEYRADVTVIIHREIVDSIRVDTLSYKNLPSNKAKYYFRREFAELHIDQDSILTVIPIPTSPTGINFIGYDYTPYIDSTARIKKHNHFR